MKIDAPEKQLEKELIQTAYKHIRDQKTLYPLIDEAHLLDINTLRKLRLLFVLLPNFPPNNSPFLNQSLI
jgi:MSHA biogenesis protein MshM